jgi:hypothetical protein
VNDGVVEIVDAAAGDPHRRGAPRVAGCGRVADGAGIIGIHEQAAQHDPCFGRLRSQPRFQELREVVRDRWERFEP